ncbi:hypothetical protein ABT167_35280 [Streptomyces sp. NPDC001792]|uniref:hypothetical protein n=1 Tax=Streptomyces sp. NPDC001792 TaxID=3154524 RepID=UPI00331EF1E2
MSRRQSGSAAWSLADCDAVAAHYGLDVLDLLAGPTRAVEALPAARRRLPRRPCHHRPPRGRTGRGNPMTTSTRSTPCLPAPGRRSRCRPPGNGVPCARD